MTDRDIRLIVTDMDGTLLNSRKSVSAHTLSVIEALRKKGILFSICTGRIQPMTVAYVETLRLQSPYITANGGLIYDPAARKVIWGKPVPGEAVLSIAEFCEKRDIDYGVLTMDTSYFSYHGRTRDRFVAYNELAKNQGLPEMKLRFSDPDLFCLREAEAYKILIFDETFERLPEAEQFLSGIPGISYTTSQPDLLDAMCEGIDKGTGVAELAKIMGIPKESVCVFGDYINDIPMFKEAGTAIAMGNAAPEVKEAADYVTKTNDEDGVAYAITDILGLL